MRFRSKCVTCRIWWGKWGGQCGDTPCLPRGPSSRRPRRWTSWTAKAPSKWAVFQWGTPKSSLPRQTNIKQKEYTSSKISAFPNRVEIYNKKQKCFNKYYYHLMQHDWEFKKCEQVFDSSSFVKTITEAKRQVFRVSFTVAVQRIVEVQERIFAPTVNFRLFKGVALEIVEERGRGGYQDLTGWTREI